MYKPLVSIIIPVYNAETTLDRCIKSIIIQTYSNFELLLINDGSIDKSADICNYYSKSDSRIININRTNGGASAARNTGLLEAKGEWIIFIDSDDYISETYLSELMCCTTTSEASLVISSPIRSDSGKIKFLRSKLSNEIFCGTQGIKNFLLRGLLIYSEPHSKLFKAEIIRDNSITFNKDVIIGEDAIFIADFLQYAKCIVTTDISGYFYCLTNTSIQKKMYDYSCEFDWFNKLKLSYLKLSHLYGLSINSESFWIVLSPLMNRYLYSVCCNKNISFFQKKKELSKLSYDDFLFYGKGRNYGCLGRISKFILNHHLISLYILLCYIKYFF